MRQIFDKSRKQRRKEAKAAGVPFKPRYAEGLEPRLFPSEEFRKKKEDE